ncbi:hypothetical protein NEOKW01_2057 [Nematocida sp. AWRm80]|nr:hypothetical protein NEOKW01_2057 [Nematocida sp. AWRm80]
MDESHVYNRVLQIAIIEILNQVGFERVNKQALQIISDIVFSTINTQLLAIKRHLEDIDLCAAHNTRIQSKESTREEGKEREEREGEEQEKIEKEYLSNKLLNILITEATGPVRSYKREELLSFLNFQLSITRQLKKEDKKEPSSLLEVLRVGETIKLPEEDRRLVDFTGEEEGEKKESEEKKYLDLDVREYLKEHSLLQIQPIKRPSPKQIFSVPLEDPIIIATNKRTSRVIKENMKDYEYMLNRKRQTTEYCTPCGTTTEIPFLDDLLIISTLRRPKKTILTETKIPQEPIQTERVSVQE